MIYILAILFNTFPGLLLLSSAVMIGATFGLIAIADRARIVIKNAALDWVQIQSAREAQRQDAALLRLNVDRARLQLSENRKQLLAAWDETIEAGEQRINGAAL